MQAEVYRQSEDLTAEVTEELASPNTPDDLIGDVFEEVYSR